MRQQFGIVIVFILWSLIFMIQVPISHSLREKELPSKSIFVTELLNLLQSQNSTYGAMTFIMKGLNIGPEKTKSQNNTDLKCYSKYELLKILNITNTTSLNESLVRDSSPIFLQQAVSRACHSKSVPETLPKPPPYLVWIYSTIAVTFVSVCALMGAILVPLSKTTIYPYCLKFCLSMAVATMVGDAVLHLIPEVIGGHNHNQVNSETKKREELEDKVFFWKTMAICIAIYLFFLIQSIGNLLGLGHGHSHDLPSEPEFEANPKLTKPYESTEYGSSHLIDRPPKVEPKEPPRVKFQKAIRLLLGGSLHNFTDGLAIGAAFSLSPTAGLSTAIAILFHELPHEIGDIAMLVTIGFSMKWAILLNVITAMCCYIGMIFGVFFSSDHIFREWVLAFTAGTFIYIGLVDMLGTMILTNLKSKRMQFILENLGMLIGFAIMAAITQMEELFK